MTLNEGHGYLDWYRNVQFSGDFYYIKFERLQANKYILMLFWTKIIKLTVIPLNTKKSLKGQGNSNLHQTVQLSNDYHCTRSGFTVAFMNISSIPGQNGVSLLYIMLEIHHSGREPSVFNTVFPARMVYLYYISCLRYTILVGNPQYSTHFLK